MEVEVLGVGAMEEEVQLEVAAAEVVEVCVSVVYFCELCTPCCSLGATALVVHMLCDDELCS